MASPLSGALASTIYKSMKSLFLDATLTRDGAPTGTAYDPVQSSATTYSCKAIAEAYSTGVQSTGLVGGSDISVIILAKSLPDGFEPQSFDRIAIASQNIAGVIADGTKGLKAVQADPARATWVCRVVV